MEKILSILGIITIILEAFCFSCDRQSIQWKSICYALIGQLVLALLLIKTPLWKVVEWIATGVTWLIGQSSEGINFVFGGISDNYVFFIGSLLPIVFISALMGILFHFGIIQKFISIVSKFIAKTLKIDTLVAVNGISNMFLGQTESLFVTKSYLSNAKDSVVFATLVGGMSTISVSVIGLYASMGADVEWIIVSIPLTMLSSFVLTQIIMPTQYSDETISIESDKGTNFIDTMMTYAMAGFKSVIGISVALMVFSSLVAMLNNILGLCGLSITLEKILGIIFYPLSLLMGIPFSEINSVSELLAAKLVLNEAVAFGMPQFVTLSMHAKAITTVALCGFAGIGSIGILIGGYSATAPNKAHVVAKLGVRALLTATIANILTGIVVSLML